MTVRGTWAIAGTATSRANPRISSERSFIFFPFVLDLDDRGIVET